MGKSPLEVQSDSEQESGKKQIYIREGCYREATSPSEQSYLIGNKCRVCGYVAFPKRVVCPACIQEDTMEEIPLSPRGKLYSYTVLHVPLPGFPAPYIIGRTQLPEGPRVTSLITGCEPTEDALDIGAEVELTIGKISEDKEGNDIIGYMFRPTEKRTGEVDCP